MKNKKNFFQVIHQSTKSKARVCEINLKSGKIITPCYVPVSGKKKKKL